MKLPLPAVLALSTLAATGCSDDAPRATSVPTPSPSVAGLVTYRPLTGWIVEERASSHGADAVVSLVDGIDRIEMRAFGGPGSDYETAADFLSGPAASTMGRPPERIGTVTVAGLELASYARGFPIHLGDPHVPSAPVTLGRELFCILPAADGRFVVLSYALESPVPDIDRRGERAWDAFLETVGRVGKDPLGPR